MDELGISQEEALRIKQLEPEDQILEITKLRTLKDKPKKAQGGRVGFSQGTPAARRGIISLDPPTPYQNDLFDSLTDEDFYKTYDERKGYDSFFKKYFVTEEGKDIPLVGPSDTIDIVGLLELFEKSKKGQGFFDASEFKRRDMLGPFSDKEREV